MDCYLRDTCTHYGDLLCDACRVNNAIYGFYARYSQEPRLISLWSYVIDRCPNKRIVHLARHGKNDRIKRKNFWRAVEIVGKELNK